MGGFWKLCFDPQKEQQIKIEGEFKPTVDCLCATRRGLVAVYIEKVRSAECTSNSGEIKCMALRNSTVTRNIAALKTMHTDAAILEYYAELC